MNNRRINRLLRRPRRDIKALVATIDHVVEGAVSELYHLRSAIDCYEETDSQYLIPSAEKRIHELKDKIAYLEQYRAYILSKEEDDSDD